MKQKAKETTAPAGDAGAASPGDAAETMSEEIRSMTEEIQPMEVDKSWSF